MTMDFDMTPSRSSYKGKAAQHVIIVSTTVNWLQTNVKVFATKEEHYVVKIDCFYRRMKISLYGRKTC